MGLFCWRSKVEGQKSKDESRKLLCLLLLAFSLGLCLPNSALAALPTVEHEYKSVPSLFHNYYRIKEISYIIHTSAFNQIIVKAIEKITAQTS